MGTTSWLDHVICTADARGCVTDMTLLYECICSDHHPLLFSIDFGTVPAYDVGGTGENKRVVHWDNLRPCDINHYSDYTDIELSKIIVPQGIKCYDPNCLNHIHRDEIDELYASIVSALKKCSHASYRLVNIQLQILLYQAGMSKYKSSMMQLETHT